MIATLLALQATVTEALPADVSNAATQTLAQATTGGGINYLELMAKASLPVKIIVLLLLVAASRLIYSMADTGSLPRFLAWVHPGVHTPARAIVLSLVVSVGFALSGDIGLVAGATNFAVFVGFAAVNLSLIVLRFRQPEVERPFRVPLSIGRVPVLPVVALGAIGFMMANLEWDALAIGGGLFLSGVVAMEVLSLWRPHAPDDPHAAG